MAITRQEIVEVRDEKRAKKEVSLFIHGRHMNDQAAGKVCNQTNKFFNTVPPERKDNFISSTRRILCLGIGKGQYLVNHDLQKKRQCIGYDFIPEAVEDCKEKGIHAKLIDLCNIENNQLAYLNELENDLSEPADILAIRIFEYLDKEAAQLLIVALMDKAKPGSMFYVETFLDLDKQLLPLMTNCIFENNEIASYIGARTNFKFFHLSVNIEKSDDNMDIIGTNSQFIAQKFK